MSEGDLDILRDMLDNLENTSDSIVGASSFFLNLVEEEAKDAVEVFFEKFQVVIDTVILKHKVTTFFTEFNRFILRILQAI